jgi:hypothetical protein
MEETVWSQAAAGARPYAAWVAAMAASKIATIDVPPMEVVVERKATVAPVDALPPSSSLA